MDFTQSIKVICDQPTASCIKIIRNYTGQSFAVIKDTIKQGDMFLISEMTDTATLEKIIKLYEELTEIGTQCEVYELGQKSSIDIFRNRLNRDHEIEQETWNEMFIEADN